MTRQSFINNIKCDYENIKYAYHIDKLLESRKKEILNFFNSNQDIIFNVYLYNTKEDFVDGLKKRGFIESPDYMCACYKDEDSSINYFEPADETSEEDWSKEEYDEIIFHEEVHAVEHALYGYHPEWLTEGIAGLLTGKYQKGKKYLLDNYISKYRIPDITELEGDTFCTNEYDGYDLSYLMISYLLDYYGKGEFLNIIKDNEEIKLVSNNLIQKSIDYYQSLNSGIKKL